MLQRTLALVTRAFHSDARDLRSHLFRVALPGLFMLTVVLLVLDQPNRDAPGLELFAWLICYDYVFVTFAAATFFATAISEEREAQTLGLLRIAGVNPVSIILGKWLPRMWTALLLLLVQLPFTLLCVTLGGVQWLQIHAAFACVMAHLILVGGIALLCSVIATTSSKASGWATVLIVLLHLCIWLLSAYRWFPLRQSGMEFLGANALFTICESSFAGHILTFQVISNLLCGALLMLLAWICFDFSTTREVTESRSSLGQSLRHITSGRERRAWVGAPLVWQAFHYVAGGFFWLFMRFGIYLVVVTGFLLWLASWSTSINADEVGATLIFCGTLATIGEGAYLAAQLFRKETIEQTWGTLCLLPESLATVAYSRLLGVIAGILPGLTCLSLGCLLMSHELSRIIDDEEFWCVLFFFVAIVVWGWHLTTLFSISIDWAAWPASIFMAVVVIVLFFAGTIICLEGTNGEEVVLVLMGLLAWGFSVLTHLLIGVKLQLKMSE